eukprot:TRINITY_DN7154_c0_g1_i1.p1 TRINITY_DN7154_c0_g1~~TRINITY_DN7154_c0_g1_i1.p1  ORF type:complete len:638 (+),score=93.77 TRINITY_DN7154_c0_g1_i1:128-2041(+)
MMAGSSESESSLVHARGLSSTEAVCNKSASRRGDSLAHAMTATAAASYEDEIDAIVPSSPWREFLHLSSISDILYDRITPLIGPDDAAQRHLETDVKGMPPMSEAIASIANPPISSPSVAAADPVASTSTVSTQTPTATGVSAQVLLLMVEELRARFPDFHSMTTADVCERWLKPITSEVTQMSFVDILIASDHPRVKNSTGVANRFVSHAWRYNFCQLTEALCKYAGIASHADADLDSQRHGVGEDENIYFWLDLFCNNQNTAVTLPYEWWSKTFADSIGKIGHTLLLYGPWDDPIPLKRSWCLFELYASVKQGSKLEIVPLDDEMLEAALETHIDEIVEAMRGMNVRKAQASKEDDQLKINEAIKCLGFGELEAAVRARLVQLWRNEAERALAADIMSPGLCTSTARLLELDGDLFTAEVLYRRAHRLVSSSRPNPSAYFAMNNLACALHRLGRLDEAARLSKEAVCGWKHFFDKLLGNRAMDDANYQREMLKAMSTHARVLLSQSDISAACRWCRDALKESKHGLEKDDTAVLRCHHDYGVVLALDGRHQDALTHFKRAAEGLTAKFGEHAVDAQQAWKDYYTSYKELGPGALKRSSSRKKRASSNPVRPNVSNNVGVHRSHSASVLPSGTPDL